MIEYFRFLKRKIMSALTVFSDEHFMRQAYREAEKAFESGEVPVGAVVVCNNRIIARAHNQTELLSDVTAHAEMIAITAAAQSLGSKYLDCLLYTSPSPRDATLSRMPSSA